MKKSILAGLVILLSVPGFSQTTPETIAVMVPVTQLFKGMNLGDSARVHSAFVNEVTFVTVAKDKSGKPALIPEPLGQFLVAVGNSVTAVWMHSILLKGRMVSGGYFTWPIHDNARDARYLRRSVTNLSKE